MVAAAAGVAVSIPSQEPEFGAAAEIVGPRQVIDPMIVAKQVLRTHSNEQGRE
jgi:hypothetical protein